MSLRSKSLLILGVAAAACTPLLAATPSVAGGEICDTLPSPGLPSTVEFDAVSAQEAAAAEQAALAGNEGITVVGDQPKPAPAPVRRIPNVESCGLSKADYFLLQGAPHGLGAVALYGGLASALGAGVLVAASGQSN